VLACQQLTILELFVLESGPENRSPGRLLVEVMGNLPRLQSLAWVRRTASTYAEAQAATQSSADAAQRSPLPITTEPSSIFSPLKARSCGNLHIANMNTCQRSKIDRDQNDPTLIGYLIGFNERFLQAYFECM
jgi:hypothetical protein